MLKLMYITNNPKVAIIAENAGVDRIFVDMEYIGKDDRQAGMDTVKSHHTISDIKIIANTIKKAELLVRVNPIHEATDEYVSSEDEIEATINNGAQIIMLPFFKTVEEVKRFIKDVNGRAKTMLLVETPEAVEVIDEILTLDGIDEIHIGLNDLSLGYHKKFMFELLADGTVDMLVEKFKHAGIPYGFGGIASIGKGDLPAEKVLGEHYRLGSTRVIVSRSFCNTNKIKDLNEIKQIFDNGIKDLRNVENNIINTDFDFESNKKDVVNSVNKILSKNS